MAFFQNEQPEEQPKAPLFKQEGGASGRHISLSDYISKHLQEGEKAPAAAPGTPATPVAKAPAFLPPGKTADETSFPQQSGMFLNSIDGDLTGGLEAYLPTPLFRFRVMKKRLDREIGELKTRLNKYERLAEKSKDMQERMLMMRQRIATLEAHERQVDRELAALLQFGPLMYWAFKRYESFQNWLAGATSNGGRWMGRLIYGKAYQQVETANEELAGLQTLFAERLQDPRVSGEEVSQLMNRYESTLHKMETAALQLKPGAASSSMLRRLWHQTGITGR